MAKRELVMKRNCLEVMDVIGQDYFTRDQTNTKVFHTKLAIATP